VVLVASGAAVCLDVGAAQQAALLRRSGGLQIAHTTVGSVIHFKASR
jgi:hypothetical protein